MLKHDRCLCLEGFSGSRCEVSGADPCSSSPCMNRSTCIVKSDLPQGFRCECHEGFVGIYCDGLVDESILTKVTTTMERKPITSTTFKVTGITQPTSRISTTTVITTSRLEIVTSFSTAKINFKKPVMTSTKTLKQALTTHSKYLTEEDEEIENNFKTTIAAIVNLFLFSVLSLFFICKRFRITSSGKQNENNNKL